MAAYAASVTTKFKSPVDVSPSGPLTVFAGRVNITNYNTTLVEITEITGKFKTLAVVVVDGVTDAGYVLRWDHAGKAFRAYYGDYDLAGDGALIETVADTDVGEADFLAIGF